MRLGFRQIAVIVAVIAAGLFAVIADRSFASPIVIDGTGVISGDVQLPGILSGTSFVF